MVDSVTIPFIVYDRLLHYAKLAGDLEVIEFAKQAAFVSYPMEAFPMDGTPVLFHTKMTLRYAPYIAKGHLERGLEGRWQWFDPRGQWVKLDHMPEGTWTVLP